jgi:methyl-accepting chemotaxis protein
MEISSKKLWICVFSGGNAHFFSFMKHVWGQSSVDLFRNGAIMAGMKSISGKALVLVLTLIVLSVTATTAFLLNHFAGVLGTDRLAQNVAAAEMIVNPGRAPYSIVDGKLMIGSRVLNGDTGSVDDVSAAFGGVATIFQGDTRISTNVMKADGSRALGTKLAAGPVYDAVLGEGKDYIGTTKILGQDYVAAYKPIKDASGQTIGILFVGFEKSAFNAQFTKAAEVAVMAGLILAAICGGIGWYVFHKLFAPFHPLAKMMEDARAGRYAEHVPYTERTDEFGELARVIELFNRSVGERRAHRAAAVEQVVSTFGEALAALAQRDLRYRLVKEVPPEYDVLKENFNAAAKELETAMTAVEQRAAEIGVASSEIHSASQQMAQRTETEAAALEQTSASLNELSEAVNHSVDGAREANAAAATAKTDATAGSEISHNAVEAIRAIAQSSSEITQIVGVINEIAFQTNLLALNAGVEAARAGDAGRGFAVVASEVRALAQRSAEAAKQIGTLISRSESQVENGVQLVEESGTAFGKIVDQIGTVYELVAAISAAQTQQASALKEIDAAIQQLDQTTQQNAAMAEQSCAAADGMKGRAHELGDCVGRFQVTAAEALPQQRTRAA